MYDNPTTLHNAEPLSEYRFAFHGTAGEYFKIWLVNLLLTFITFGIFSAWAKVRNKRYFHGNTTLNGFSFDYHARPLSILVSRLLIITFVFGGAAVAAWGSVQLAGDDVLGSAIHTTLLYFLLPWALVRSFSFNARYSSYRGVRFHFNRVYAKIYWIFTPALILVLAINIVFVFTPLPDFETPQGATGFFFIGVLFFLFFFVLPASVRAFHRFKTVHHAWGNTSFNYDAPPLVKFVAPLMGIFLLLPIVISAAFFAVLGHEADVQYLTSIAFLLLAAVYLSPLFLAAYLFRLYWLSVRFGGGAVQCDFSAAEYYFKVLLVNLFATILSMGLLYPWAKVRKARFLANRMRLLVPAAAMDSILKRHEEKESALGEEFDSVEGFDFDVGLI